MSGDDQQTPPQGAEAPCGAELGKWRCTRAGAHPGWPHHDQDADISWPPAGRGPDWQPFTACSGYPHEP